MSNYLVVAHQTAMSEELQDKLREIAGEDESASFTLLVPATPVQHLLTFHEGEAVAEATRVASEAREALERAGLRVTDARVGDASPLEAIADLLRDHREYDGIVISTLPSGVSRWLKLDVHARARKKFDVPVISVIGAKPMTPANR